MKNFSEMAVGKIVADNFKQAQVFDQYKIDFCCNGAIEMEHVLKNKIV